MSSKPKLTGHQNNLLINMVKFMSNERFLSELNW